MPSPKTKSSANKRSPKRQAPSRVSQRKGSIVTSAPKDAAKRIKKLSQENGGITQMRKYTNGSIGVFFKNKKFRFVSGGDNLKPRKKGSKVRYAKISKLAATRALHKYYNNKNYTSPANRKAALTRDICSDNKPRTRTTKYRRSPHLYDYPGVDDGSTCPKGHPVTHKRRMSKAKKQALAKRLQSGGGGQVYVDNAINRRLNRVGNVYSATSSKGGNIKFLSATAANNILKKYQSGGDPEGDEPSVVSEIPTLSESDDSSDDSSNDDLNNNNASDSDESSEEEVNENSVPQLTVAQAAGGSDVKEDTHVAVDSESSEDTNSNESGDSGSQTGGAPISLNNAVNLLRQYYTLKYGQ